MCLRVRDSHETFPAIMYGIPPGRPRPWAQRAYFLHAMRGGGLRRRAPRRHHAFPFVYGGRCGAGPGCMARVLASLSATCCRSTAFCKEVGHPSIQTGLRNLLCTSNLYSGSRTHRTRRCSCGGAGCC